MLLSFFAGDYSEMKVVPEDVFFEDRGLLYSQFYKGQSIPIGIWEKVFGSDKNKELLPEKTEQTQEPKKTEEPVELEVSPEVEEKLEESPEKVSEDHQKTKRHKSIIKK